MRTALLTWEFKCLDLILLADESYHDQEKAAEVMKQLNSDRCACSASYVLPAMFCQLCHIAAYQLHLRLLYVQLHLRLLYVIFIHAITVTYSFTILSQLPVFF